MPNSPGQHTGQTICLPAILDRDATAMLLPILTQAAQGGSVQVDGGSVERVGQIGLQLLLSLVKSAPLAKLVAASPALQRAIELAGLEDRLPIADAELAR